MEHDANEIAQDNVRDQACLEGLQRVGRASPPIAGVHAARIRHIDCVLTAALMAVDVPGRRPHPQRQLLPRRRGHVASAEL